MPRFLLALSSLLTTPLALAAQEPRILRHAGDTVGPANLVSFELLSAAQVADFPSRGTVLVRADTDASDASDEMLLRIARDEATGSMFVALDLREGDPEPGNPAAPLRAFPDADVTALGQGARAQILVSGAFSSTHLYWDATPIARSGGTVALPGNHGPNRLVHVSFRHTRANGARKVLVAGVIWPLLADTVPPFPVLLRYQLDASGAVTSCEVVLDARGNTPVFPMPYEELPSDGRATDFDAAGGWVTRARGVDGRWRVVRGDVELALEGAPAPLAGRLWSALGDDQPVALRPSGGVAFVGKVDGDPAEARVLVQDGVVLARQGELLPALAPQTIEPRADTNLAYTADGELLWLANLSGGGQALLRGREVLLASGALVEARALLTIEDFVATPGGRFVFLDAVLATGNALVRLDLGAAELVAPCTAPNAGSLWRTAGAVAVGASFELTLDAPVPSGSLATLTLASFGGSCETSFPFGEVYLAAGTILGRFPVGLYAGAPLTTSIPVPNDVGLIGAEGFCQGAFLTPVGSSPRIVLTNGLRLEVGAP
jgi:hypothetical protein